MPYELGVDLGTTYTAAAVRRDGASRVVQLGTESQALASVLAARDDGELIVGEAAERRAATHPARAVREFKRRFGDPAPIVLGGRAWSAEELTARLLGEVIERTTAIEGKRPARLALAHPAAWGPFRLDVLRAAAGDVGYPDAVLVPEPVAAARANADRVPSGSLVAVYDLGGGTFDAAVVRATDVLEIVGTPEGVERLGGVDIDQAILNHVDTSLGGVVATADAGDPETASALSRLRDECRRAKEALSADTEVEIPVLLPSVRSSVRLTRAELEGMIRPRLMDSLAVLDRVVSSTGASWADVHGVLLVGGSSRIPLIGQMVAEHTDRPVLTTTNPAFSIALGTVQSLAADGDSRVAVSSSAAHGSMPVAAAAVSDQVVPAAASRSTRDRTTEVRRSGKRGLVVGVTLAGVAAAVIGGLLLASGGGEDADALPPTSVVTPATTVAPQTTAGPTETTVGAAATTAVTGSSVVADELAPVQVGARTVTPMLCVGADAELAGATDLAASDGHVFVLSAGSVRALSSDDACVLAVDEAVTARSSFPIDVASISAAPAGALAGTGPDGGGLITPDGSFIECELLLDRVRLSAADSTAMTWRRGGQASLVNFGARGCAADQRGRLPFEVVDVAEEGRSYLLGIRGENGALVVRLTNGQPEWTQGSSDPTAADGYLGIDGLGRCGPVACVLDAEAGRLHLVSDTGDQVGAVAIAELLGATAAERLVTAADGTAWLLVTIDGSARLAKVTVS
jgi:actin-like ATPase involved in cell morphogenesis